MAGTNPDGWQQKPSRYTRRHIETKEKEEKFATHLDVCSHIQNGKAQSDLV